MSSPHTDHTDHTRETLLMVVESQRLREQLAATSARLEVLLPLLEAEIERYKAGKDPS